jgi:amino acid transporter
MTESQRGRDKSQESDKGQENADPVRSEGATDLAENDPGQMRDTPRSERHPVRIVSWTGEQRAEQEGEETEEQLQSNPLHVQPDDAPGQRAAERAQDRISGSSPSANSEHKVRSDLREEEYVRGAHPGDRYIRHVRSVGPFRRRSAGKLTASLAADRPRTRWGRLFHGIKRVMVGEAISTEHSIHERLTKAKALAVLSSDPLSSVAYATEEILRVLLLAGVAAVTGLTLPIGLAIVVLLAIVAVSYRQTIAAYPRGGGSYIVTKDNLGTLPGLTAAASILIDYTMTVAVSVSAGIAAIYSLFPEVRSIRVEICVFVVILITVINLRGVRESGNIFALPTYLFILGMLGMIGYGLLRLYLGVGQQMVYVPPAQVLPYGTEGISIFLILRAFTQGCTALTGVEAISDGVPAFKPPEAKNARTTLAIMAVTAISMFSGITFLATQLHLQPSDQETVLSQLARTVFPQVGGINPIWFYIQIVTALILVLAANTAFADFPRLSYFLARDRFMPRQYAFRGDKLAFSWGIITLAILACILVIAFDGDTTALIPLYTVGVFNSFTLSQSGMVVRWWRTRTQGWQRNLVVNGLGALTTGLVLVISAVTKFQYGAWIVLVLIPILIVMFLAINRHYTRVEKEEYEQAEVAPQGATTFKHTFIVPVSRLSPVTLTALNYARSLSNNVTAVHIVEGEDPIEAEQFIKEWQRVMSDTDINIVMIESPFRSLIGPLISYIDALDQQNPDDTITVVLPEALPSKPWEYLLHNQTAFRLKATLLFRENTVVTDVPRLLGRHSRRGSTKGRPWRLADFPWGSVLLLLLVIYVLYHFLFER